MPVAAKAFFTVTAGIIPGEPIDEHCRQWCYTSQDLLKDATRALDEPTTFVAYRDKALEHARDNIDPRHVNWVHLEFVWA